MSILTALARAEAVESGKAQPLTTVRHTHIAANPLVLVPLSLAGEAAAPLAAIVGTDPAEPRVLVVANPRDRTQRFDFVAELARVVLSYVDGCARSVDSAASGTKLRYAEAPQVIVPNRGGIEFVRLLGRSTRFRRPFGPYPVHRTVPILGQWLTFLRERADHPGSSMLLAMTEVLGNHWATGQSGLEDANLAALLGWIDPPGGLDGAAAAALAEDPLRSPPAGPSTDPTFDNEILAPALAAVARSDGDDFARERALAALTAAVADQMQPTWDLTWQAVRLLRARPAGASVETRWAMDRDVFTMYHMGLAEGTALPQPRRDSAVAAAGRLDRLEREQARFDAQRALDDPLVMAEFRLSGEAFTGTVVAASPNRVDTSGKKAALRPHITVQTDDPVRLEPGALLVSPARLAQQAMVVEVSSVDVTLELSKGMGRSTKQPAPGSVPAVGERVTYGPVTDAYQPPGRFPSRDDTPWTHGGPPPAVEYGPSENDAVEDWS
ncbi:hypothetical protein ACQEVZ_35740 [Dactylosporangium sp. CA-152071]|uniref:hypothetical protein n=1 Tax=Dactylosporangium sp. CA-152071 TaxID=3239933 RepID=UPI003D8BB694